MKPSAFSLFAAGVLLTACATGEAATTTRAPDRSSTTSPPPSTTTLTTASTVPPPPQVPRGSLKASLADDLETLMASLATGVDRPTIVRIGDSKDARVAWVLADLLRFIQVGTVAETAETAFADLTGTRLDPIPFGSAWVDATDLLIAWDLPAPPGYLDYKRRMYTLVEPLWEPFFEADAKIDWRYVSWGGVLIDDRPHGDDSPCSRGCIPALDDPVVTAAPEGSWYPDTSIVFGIVVGHEARAYPKNIMETHEMVNDTLGGRRLGIPYCTLCGSAQAYLTDGVPTGVKPPLLRTSGLLVRSNKMMFDLNTFSLIDTFRGTAVSGPLAQGPLQLDQVSVVTSTWGEWKASHPETTIVAEDGGIGRTYAADPLGGRDAGGPIFPIGPVDPRLPAHTQVFGVETPGGQYVAFPVTKAKDTLDRGSRVELAGVVLVADGSGLRAELSTVGEVAGHQAFWFAWSQFHPETLLWLP